jgi:hypothetical protein
LHSPLQRDKNGFVAERGFSPSLGVRACRGFPAHRRKLDQGQQPGAVYSPPQSSGSCFLSGDGASVVPGLSLGPAAGANRTGQEGVKVALLSSARWRVCSTALSQAQSSPAAGIPAGARGDGERAQTPPRPGARRIGSAGGQPGSQLPPGSPSGCCQAASQPGKLGVCSALPAEDM